MTDIARFQGDYLFLSNFYIGPVLHDGYTWPSGEHAYQAAKTDSLIEKGEFAHINRPGEAKRRGRWVTLRDDWELIKADVMLSVLRAKFQDDDLADQMTLTGRGMLIEGNHWHDNYWGICTCPRCPGLGENKLGHLLMKVRRSLR